MSGFSRTITRLGRTVRSADLQVGEALPIAAGVIMVQMQGGSPETQPDFRAAVMQAIVE